MLYARLALRSRSPSLVRTCEVERRVGALLMEARRLWRVEDEEIGE